MSEEKMMDTVDDLLDAADAERKMAIAKEQREVIASDLERLAIDIRIGRYNPTSFVGVVIEPDIPSIARIGSLTVGELRMARDYLSDLESWDRISKYLQQANREEWLKAHHDRRVRGKKEVERKRIARQVEFPYQCRHCPKRFKTKRGQSQHEGTQKRLGCSKCGTPRCGIKSVQIDYSTHYRGVATCFECVDKS